jgi:tetratricopeptide (TPR) repeat protein
MARADAIGWFEAEQDNLLAAQRAAENGGEYQLCWEIAEALWSFYLARHGWLTSWIKVHKRGVDAARAAGHRAAEVRQRCYLAHAHLAAEDLDAAAVQAEFAVLLAEDLGQPALYATALSGRAKCATAAVDHAHAVSLLTRAIECDYQGNNPRGAEIHRRRRGEALAQQGDLDAAAADLRAAVTGMLTLGQLVEAARCRTYLGEALIKARHYDQARAELNIALDVMQDSGSPRYLGDVHFHLGVLAMRTGDDTSVEHLLNALKLRIAAGDPQAIAGTNRLLDDLRNPTGQP